MCRLGYLSLLVSTKLKVLAPFQGYLFPVLTLSAFHTKNNFLGCFGLLVENWFGLTTISRLFTIVATFSLGVQTGFTRLVLSHFV